MSFFVTTPTLRAPSESYSEPSPFLTVRLFRAILQFVDDHPWTAFALLSAACAWGHLSPLVSRHLYHDELFTCYIAHSSSVGQLLALTRTIDLHPPLSYLLVRLSFAMFGVSSWSCRLPFVLAFLATGGLLYFLVCRIVSPIYGLIVLLMLWSSSYARLAIAARPYALVGGVARAFDVCAPDQGNGCRLCRSRLNLLVAVPGKQQTVSPVQTHWGAKRSTSIRTRYRGICITTKARSTARNRSVRSESRTDRHGAHFAAGAFHLSPATAGSHRHDRSLLHAIRYERNSQSNRIAKHCHGNECVWKYFA